jgi:hypothetical protein
MWKKRSGVEDQLFLSSRSKVLSTPRCHLLPRRAGCTSGPKLLPKRGLFLIEFVEKHDGLEVAEVGARVAKKATYFIVLNSEKSMQVRRRAPL